MADKSMSDVMHIRIGKVSDEAKDYLLHMRNHRRCGFVREAIEEKVARDTGGVTLDGVVAEVRGLRAEVRQVLEGLASGAMMVSDPKKPVDDTQIGKKPSIKGMTQGLRG